MKLFFPLERAQQFTPWGIYVYHTWVEVEMKCYLRELNLAKIYSAVADPSLHLDLVIQNKMTENFEHLTCDV